MEIEFCDLKKQYGYMKEEIDEAVSRVISRGDFINGREIKLLEEKCKDFVRAQYAIAVSSGTDALLISLMALDVQPGDVIVTTPFTFISTVEVITLLKAKPVFIDIDPNTFNLDCDKLEQYLNTTKEKVKGIIGVNIFGLCCDYNKIREIIKGRDIFLLEDGAQSFGSMYNSKMACALGDISITSFFPAKPLGCYGDGGMIFTDDINLAEKAKMIRNHGQIKKYTHNLIGINGRMDTIQAAILLVKLKHFDKEISNRVKNKLFYNRFLHPLINDKTIRIQRVEKDWESVVAQYSIIVDRREELIEWLSKNKIPTAIHYPTPLHLQPAFEYLGYKERDFPIAEYLSKHILSLPFDAYKSKEEIEFITRTIYQKIYKV